MSLRETLFVIEIVTLKKWCLGHIRNVLFCCYVSVSFHMDSLKKVFMYSFSTFTHGTVKIDKSIYMQPSLLFSTMIIYTGRPAVIVKSSNILTI